jgi:FkbM family methyltransferase
VQVIRLALALNMVRDILRKLSRGVVLKRHLPREYGHQPMFVSPDSALAYWRWDLKKVDPLLLSMARELVRKDMTVWDIGANVGLFSFAAAALGARVLAVEADTWLADLLRRSANLNGLPVNVLSVAVADTLGVSELHLSKEGRASNSLTGSGSSHPVVTVTLDWLLDRFAVPDLLKIDIEGSECAALRGAPHLLQHQPVIFCEVSQNHDDVARILSGAGYTLYAARERDRQPINRPSRDTLALPTAVSHRNHGMFASPIG